MAVQFAPAFNVLPQVVVREKSAASVPVSVMAIPVCWAVPVLESVKSLVAELSPMPTLPKFQEEGFHEVDAVPVAVKLALDTFALRLMLVQLPVQANEYVVLEGVTL